MGYPRKTTIGIGVNIMKFIKNCLYKLLDWLMSDQQPSELQERNPIVYNIGDVETWTREELNPEWDGD